MVGWLVQFKVAIFSSREHGWLACNYSSLGADLKRFAASAAELLLTSARVRTLGFHVFFPAVVLYLFSALLVVLG